MDPCRCRSTGVADRHRCGENRTRHRDRPHRRCARRPRADARSADRAGRHLLVVSDDNTSRRAGPGCGRRLRASVAVVGGEQFHPVRLPALRRGGARSHAAPILRPRRMAHRGRRTQGDPRNRCCRRAAAVSPDAHTAVQLSEFDPDRRLRRQRPPCRRARLRGQVHAHRIAREHLRHPGIGHQGG